MMIPKAPQQLNLPKKSALQFHNRLAEESNTMHRNTEWDFTTLPLSVFLSSEHRSTTGPIAMLANRSGFNFQIEASLFPPN